MICDTNTVLVLGHTYQLFVNGLYKRSSVLQNGYAAWDLQVTNLTKFNESFLWFRPPFWMASSGQQKRSEINDNLTNFAQNLCNFGVSMAPADPLTPLGAMMTSSNGNIFRVTGPLSGEFTGHRWIPLTKASDAELWSFLWSAPQ